MKLVNRESWVPTDNLILEENALQVAKSDSNILVVAGPGAGKTELLAQRACYLLQTNTCKFPHKILAISFKKDAAYNLKERVKLRCGDDLSNRFDSLTFDSFAKQILDRFKNALPPNYSIHGEYDVMLSDANIIDFYTAENPDYVNSNKKDIILNFHTDKQLPLDNISSTDKIKYNVWQTMLNSQSPKLTFRMIMRLADLIVRSNPKIKRYLQETYHYVFLDEFQDTTQIQYDFFKSCFLNSSSNFTAVGDDKQRIMLWAGAKKTVFDDFISEMHADRISLAMNFRCAPRLVNLQNHLIKHLLSKNDFAIPSTKWRPDQGECFIWMFKDQASEAQGLFNAVNNWILNDGVKPRDICILVKQQLSMYAGKLITFLNDNGIKARDEEKFQELLTQEVCLYIIHCMYLIFSKKVGESKTICFSFLNNLHAELDDSKLLKLEVVFDQFIKRMRTTYNTPLSENQIQLMVGEIVDFANKERIKSVYPAYRGGKYLDNLISQLQTKFFEAYNPADTVLNALDNLIGKDAIPVMTVHKSKGLEYHTVVFVGLEDGAFWSFAMQPDEDKCSFFVALSRAKERVVFTFSNKREGKFGVKTQTVNQIKVIFDELSKSGIVITENK